MEENKAEQGNTAALLQEFFSKVVEAGKTGQAVGDNPIWPANSFRFQGRKAISASMAPYRERLRAAHAARGPRRYVATA